QRASAGVIARPLSLNLSADRTGGLSSTAHANGSQAPAPRSGHAPLHDIAIAVVTVAIIGIRSIEAEAWAEREAAPEVATEFTTTESAAVHTATAESASDATMEA